ncbi:MAG: GvpL/GvpF family gas vesicle protein [Candidatus Omnitrophica bacterium]|nr:GvpL/GvpF family gas vesicle protein [Candidatus Omnitrophota bacterium]
MCPPENHVFYLYGFTRAKPGFTELGETAEGTLANLGGKGVNGRQTPFMWRHGEVAAALCFVERDEFCGPQAEAHLADLAWLGPRACAHQEIVTAVLALAPVLPARFGTLFTSLGFLRDTLFQHQEIIVSFLNKVEGLEEWALKGRCHRRQAEETLFARAKAKASTLPITPGQRYLHEQRLRRQARDQCSLFLESTCRTVAEELCRLASDFRTFPVALPAAGDKAQPAFSNWAFLVPRGNACAFRTKLDQVNASQTPFGLCFDLSGPWPPYSFCPNLGPAIGQPLKPAASRTG